MRALQYFAYAPAYEAATRLLQAATQSIPFVAYRRKNGDRMACRPFLPANGELYSIETILHQHYSLCQFDTMGTAFAHATGVDAKAYFRAIWTLAYYTGMKEWSSEEVFVGSDGVTITIPPLFHYEGAFQAPCDYESLKPPRRAFQVNWFYFAQNLGDLPHKLPCLKQAVAHFTQAQYYR